MANIKFGTDGWRAIVGKDFNEENVSIVTNSIGKYIKDNFEEKSILIGYDPRNKAKEFATLSAEILKNAGFNVLLSNCVIPTPVLAFGAKHHDMCAIMFTASHNPPEYLGMKFIPNYAGPATSEITDALTINLGFCLDKEEKGKIELYDFKPEYFKHLESLINFEKIKNLKSKIIFDGLYSATINYFDKILDNYNIPYSSLHMKHDINFGGGMPEPKPKFLKELIETIKKDKNSAGFANDGDGDRFGVINENGEYVTPNEILAILLLYLKDYRNLQGCLVKTVAGSFMLDKIAENFGIEVVETPVGFKHVGEAMRKFNPIIGGEESGGLSIQGHIPEKDGILANLLILEAMAVKNMTLVELQNELKNLLGVEFLNDRIDLKLENQDQVKTALNKLDNIEKISVYDIIDKNKKDGIKLYLKDKKSWILLRASGTEPLLRIYFETENQEKMNSLQENVLKLIKE